MVRRVLHDLWNEERGQDLAEYALLVALIAIVVILAVTALGSKVNDIFEKIAADMVPK